MSGFLRFFRVFAVAVVCIFAGATAWATGSTNLRYTLDDQGARVASVPSAFDIGGAVQQLTSTPYKPGYGYAGHWTETECGGTEVINYQGNVVESLSASATLYACWVPLKNPVVLNSVGDSFVFILNANGGNSTGNMWSNYINNMPISFYTNSNYFNTYRDGIMIKFENRGDWAYMVRYDSGTTWWVTFIDESLQASHAGATQPLELSPLPQLAPGYVFDGYYANSNGTGTQFFSDTGASVNLRDLWTNNSSNWSDYNTIYAQWRPAVYEVTFATGGNYGSGTPDPSSVFLRYREGWYDTRAHANAGGDTGKITGLTRLPTNGNLVFNGYYTGENHNGTQIVYGSGALVPADTLTAITGNVTVYPDWSPLTVTWAEITLTNDASGGGRAAGGSSGTNRLYYPLNNGCTTTPGYRGTRDCDAAVVTNIQVPEHSSGLAFYGYYDDSTTPAGYRVTSEGLINSHVPTENEMWTSEWAPTSFNVSYSGGTGSVPNAPQSCTYGSGSCLAPDNTYNVPTGRQFAGWSCVVNGFVPGTTNTATTVNCNPGSYQSGDDLSYAINVQNIRDVSGITLSPIFVPQTYTYRTITLNPNDGTGNRPPVVYEVYNVGWFSTQNSNSQITNVFTGGGVEKPSRDNYTFGGYCEGSDNCTTRVIDSDGNILAYPTYDSNQTLYADWISDAGNVSFDVNCGNTCNGTLSCSLSCNSIQAIPGAAFPQLQGCIPTKQDTLDQTDYIFVGYYDAAIGGHPYYLYDGTNLNATNYNGGVWPSNVPQTLYAHWDREPNDVNYYCASGGEVAFSDRANYICPNYTIRSGGTPELCPNQASTASAAGQKFDQWSIIENNSVVASYANNQSVSWGYAVPTDLIASYNPIYRVNLNHNGASNSPIPDVAYFSDGNWYSDASATRPLQTMPVPPAREGYQFNGYKLDDLNHTVVANNSGVFQTGSSINAAINTNGLTISADWAANEYHVTLSKNANDAQNGTVTTLYEMYDTGWGKTSGGSYVDGLELTGGELPTRAGYIFAGYYDDPDEGEGTRMVDAEGLVVAASSTLTDNNQTWYAHWTLPAPSNSNEYFAVTTTNLQANTDTRFAFEMSAYGDFYVQWDADDNSTIDHIVRSNGSNLQVYEHTYHPTTSGSKTIKIWGNATGYGNGPVISFGRVPSQLTPGLVAGISGSLGAVFPTLGNGGSGNVPLFIATFQNCTSLTGNIPENLFGYVDSNGNYVGVTGGSLFVSTFDGTNITSIPENLFGRVINGTYYGVSGAANLMFAETFYNTNITSIPANLFSGISGAATSMFEGTFAGTNITSIPANLFSGISGAATSMFEETFAGTNITSLPSGLFSGVTGTASDLFNSTFSGCSGLSGKYIPKDLFNLNSGGLTYNASNGMMTDIFDDTGLITDCSTVGLTHYPTSYDNSYWDGKKICAPAAVFSCVNPSFGGTGTPSPSVIWMDQITGSTTLPAATNCTAPTHYTKPSTAYWACTGNSNCTGNRWAADGAKPSWLTSSVTPSVNFYMEYTPLEYTVTFGCDGGTWTLNESETATYTPQNLVPGPDADIDVPPTSACIKSGYTFTQWKFVVNGETVRIQQQYNGSQYGPWAYYSDIQIVPDWTENNGPFTVTFGCGDSGTGTIPGNLASQSVMYDGTVTVPANTQCSYSPDNGHVYNSWQCSMPAAQGGQGGQGNFYLIAGTTNQTQTWSHRYGAACVPSWTPVQTTIALNVVDEDGAWPAGLDDEYKLLYTTYGVGVYRDAARTESMDENSHQLHGIPTKTATVTFNYNDGGATANTSTDVPLVFNGFYFERNTQVINGNGYITSAGLSAGTGYTTNYDWVAQWGPTTLLAAGISFPTDPVRNGYVFDGWYTAAEGGTSVSSSTQISGNVTWHAHWTQCSHTLPANSHSTMSAVTLSNQCYYTVTCEPCAGTNPAVYGCYTQNGGLTNYGPSTFNVLAQGTSGELSAGVCHAREYNIEYSNLANHNATMPGTEPTSYTYGSTTTIDANNATPISPTEVFESWCTGYDSTNGTYSGCAASHTMSNTAYDDKTYYAKWSGCATGYTKYDYATYGTEFYGASAEYHPENTCMPIRYHVNCHSNCPSGETCKACLEDFYFPASSSNPDYGHWHFGGAYNTMLFKTESYQTNNAYLPVYPYNGSFGDDPNTYMWWMFARNPGYKFWQSSGSVNNSSTTLFDLMYDANNSMLGNYVNFMNALAGYNNSSFGAGQHYTFGGLYTATNGGIEYIPANGHVAWVAASSNMSDAQHFQNFFWENNISPTSTNNGQYFFDVYAHWIPNVYSVNLSSCADPTDQTTCGTAGSVTSIKQKWAAGWSKDGGANFVTAANFGLSGAELPTTAPTGKHFAGYRTGTNCGGNLIINANGTLNGTGFPNLSTATYFEGDTTLYACYAPNTYTVTYDCGTYLQSGASPVSDSVEYDSYYTPKSAGDAHCMTSVVGFYFDGWNVIPGNNNSDIKSAGVSFQWKYTGNQTFMARWIRKTYNISLEAGTGATPGTQNILMVYDNVWRNAENDQNIQQIVLPTKPGYTFAGYGMEVGGQMVTYISGATLPEPNLNFHDSATSTPVNITLYAQWTPNTYHILYYPNGGTHTGTPATGTYDADVAIAVPSRNDTNGNPGHRLSFAGWNISGMTYGITHYYGEDGTNYSSDDGTMMFVGPQYTHFKNLRATEGNVEFRAQWNCEPGWGGNDCSQAGTHTVTVVAGNGVGTVSGGDGWTAQSGNTQITRNYSTGATVDLSAITANLKNGYTGRQYRLDGNTISSTYTVGANDVTIYIDATGIETPTAILQAGVSGSVDQIYNYQDVILTASATYGNNNTYDGGITFDYKFAVSDDGTTYGEYVAGNVAGYPHQEKVLKNEFRGQKYYKARIVANGEGSLASAAGLSDPVTVKLENKPVRFNGNSGVIDDETVTVSASPLYVAYDDANLYTTATGNTTATVPTATTDHYGFTGWYNADENGNMVYSSTLYLVQSLTDWTANFKWAAVSGWPRDLYAYWDAKTFTVTLNPDGGTFGQNGVQHLYEKWKTGWARSGSSTSVPATTFNISSALTPAELPTTSDSNKKFGGYWTGQDCTGRQIITPNGELNTELSGITDATQFGQDATIYACWAPKRYAITYETYGGSDTLPAGYTMLRYIAANGNQWFDTGVQIKRDYEIQAKFYLTSADRYLYGVSIDSTYGVTAYNSSSGNWRWGEKAKALSMTAGSTYTITQNKNGVTVNGTLNAYSSQSDFTTARTLYVGARHNTDDGVSSTNYRFNGNIYWLRILDENGRPIRNFVPAKNANNVAGMYDTVNGVFYPSASETAFTAGSVLNQQTNLPNGYTPVNYIQSNGNQMIDTGIPMTDQGLRLVIDAQRTSSSSEGKTRILAGYYGSYNGTFVDAYNTYWSLNGSSNYISGSGNRTTLTTVFDLNGTHNRAKLTIGGTTKTYTRSNSNDPVGIGSTVKLFAGTEKPRDTVDAFVGRVYGVKIYRGTTGNDLLFDGVPAMRESDGALGLYDRVSGGFFTNAWDEDKFTRGTPLPESYPDHYMYGVGTTVYGVPTRANSIFQGWCRDPQLTICSSPHEITTSDSGDKQLYAKWACVDGYTLNSTTHQCDANTITINYRNQGYYDGSAYTGEPNGTPNPATQTCTYGGMFQLAGAMTDSGNQYAFEEWEINGRGFNPGQHNVSCDNNTLGVYSGSVYADAVWSQYGYTVTYDCNTPNIPNNPAPSQSNVTLNVPFTPRQIDGYCPNPGYTFAGWSLSSDGTTGIWQNGDAWTTTDNATLYAQWTPNEYNISYEWNGGTVNSTALPSGYTRVEYLKSYGTQVIETGLLGINKRVVIDAQYEGTNDSNTRRLVGYGSNVGTYLAVHSNQWVVYTTSAGSATTRTKVSVVFDVNTASNHSRAAVTTANDEKTVTASSLHSNGELKIFGVSDSGNFSGRVYGVRVYDKDTDELLFDGIPVLNSSNTPGIYDLVRHQFHENVNEGATAPFGYDVADTDPLYPNKYTYGVGATIYGVPVRANSVFQGWCRDPQLTICSTPHVITTTEMDPVTLYAKWSCARGYAWDDDTQACVFAPVFTVTTTPIASDATESARTFKFNIAAAGYFMVDWGDGNLEIIERGDDVSNFQYTHTYAAPAEDRTYTIGFAGRATGYNSGDSVPAVSFFNGEVDSDNNVTANGTETIIAEISGNLGAIFPTIYSGISNTFQPCFYQTFRNAINMTQPFASITDLFVGVYGAPRHSMFSGTFRNCPQLTGAIPADLFGRVSGGVYNGIDGAPAHSMFRNTFLACSGLSGSIPENLFGRSVNGVYHGINGAAQDYMFSGTFYGCSGLSGNIPANLFGREVGGAYYGVSDVPKPYMFYSTFYNCSRLSGAIPENLFGRMINGTYYGINGAPKNYMFYATFYNCSGLSGTIPANLFGRDVNGTYYGIKGIPASRMFGKTFEGCTGLTGIGGALFGGISGTPQPNMFYNTFSGCTGLSGEIPSNLFGTPTGTAATNMFSGTFRNCSGLTGTIPGNLFGGQNGLSGAGKANMFQETFFGCTNLSGYVPEYLFGTMTNSASVSNEMTDVFADSGLDTECPCGTTSVTNPFSSFWRSTSTASTPKKVSCRVGLKTGEHWYNGVCTTECSNAAMDRLHVGSLDPYIVLADPVSAVKNLAVKYNDTICYVPVASGNGGTNSMNMSYAGNVYHADRPDDSAPVGFGQRD